MAPQRARQGAVGSAVATSLSTIVVAGSAAAAGILLAQKFGRSPETDGFLAAYGVYLVLAIVAQTLRVVLVPELTRAARDQRLAAEAWSYAFSLVAVAVPASCLALAFAGPLGDAITAELPRRAATTAGSALAWLVAAGFAQVLAAAAAAVLAASDSYLPSALGFASGALAALVVFVALADSHGPLALAWGTAVNSIVALVIPLAALARDRSLWRSARALAPLRRLGRMLQVVALPIALQALYVIAVRLAAGLDVGDVTSLSYGYIFAAAVVAATASSLAFVSSAPLTRRGLDVDAAAEHVVHTTWLSLVVVAGAAAVFGLVGGDIVHAVLGSAFAGDPGRELGRLVVALAPWMVASIALAVTFPLLFVFERAQVLVPLALATVALDVGLSLLLRSAFGLEGLALALGLSTLAVLALVLATISRRTLEQTAFRLATSALAVAAVAAATFGPPALFLPDAAAAAAGVPLYALGLLALRPRALREAWAYVRALH